MLEIYKEMPLEQLCDLKSWMITRKYIRLTEMFIILHSIKIIISIPYTLRHCKYLINMRSRFFYSKPEGGLWNCIRIYSCGVVIKL